MNETSAVTELWDYVRPGSGTDYDFYHRPRTSTQNKDHLQKFLHSTMDEVRLWYANSYSGSILRIIDLEDADHFRQGLLRREITGNIAYQQQRDHSAHTLYNYILGWYFFSKSSEIRKVISHHFEVRGISEEHDLFQKLYKGRNITGMEASLIVSPPTFWRCLNLNL